MAAALHPRDLIVCILARQQQLVSDELLEAIVREWTADPTRPLIDALAERARLSETQLARLRSTADRQATETMVDPLGIRLQMLPPSLRELLAPGGSHGSAKTGASDKPTQRGGGDTKRIPPGRPGATWAEQTEGLTPGERFDVLQIHAQGGLGVVFLARDREIDRTVALKQIKAQWADDADSRARFLLEARVTGRLEHPGVVPIYALGADASGRPYYAMRFIRGESLLEVIERFHRSRTGGDVAAERNAELRKLLQRFLDVCHAVDYAHNKGVIHRDLKPSNIMLGKYGETLVVDWGLAKVIGSEEDVALTTRMVAAHHPEGDGTSTQLGAAIGTPAYMSPEQAAGRHHELTPATDVYSLGATLYHLLTGELPHADDADPGVAIAKAEFETITPPRRRASWTPRPLDSICMKALAPNPNDRYLSTHALAEDIERWLADEPVAAHADSLGERAFRWMRNHRTFVITFVAVDLVATAAIVLGVLGWNHLAAERRKMKEAAEKQQTVLRQRDERERTEIVAAVQGAEQSAAAEESAGRYSAALRFLNGAARSLAEQPSLKDELARIETRRGRVRRLVDYERAGDRAEELAFFQHDAESRAALYEALTAIGVFDRADWWAHLPADDLSPEQLDRLQDSVYRKLLLLGAAHTKETLKNLLNERGADQARQVLAINEMVQRFRPAESTRWHAGLARMRLSQGLPPSAAELAAPQNAADAYMLGGIWMIASQNDKVRTMLSSDGRDPLEACKRRLRTVEAMSPTDYWSHVLLAYVEMMQANQTDEGRPSPEDVHAHFARARQSLGHAIAIRPDRWLAYAERSTACRQEIEARRAAGRTEFPPDWETTDELLQMMIHDSKYALELAGSQPEAAWYSAFALDAAGQTEPAVDALLAAVEHANRYDVETTARMIDLEIQRALPTTVRIADRLLVRSPGDPRSLLLRAAAKVRLKDLDAAAADVAAALAAGDPPPQLLSVRGEIRLGKKEYADAAADFQAALARLPKHAPSLLGLGACREASGDFSQALEVYDRAAAAASAPYERSAAQLGRSRALYALGRPSDALEAAADARRRKRSCELTSLVAAAGKKHDEAFLARLRDLAREPRVVELTAGRPAEPGVLPLLNPGFELGLLEHWNNDDVGGLAWHNVGGDHSRAETTNQSPRGGRKSLHIEQTDAEATDADAGRGYGVTSQTVPADPRARYRVTVWARAQNLSAGGVVVAIDDRLEQPVVALRPGTYDWAEFSGEFDLAESKAPLREGLKSAAIRIIARGTGQAWLDDLRIEELAARTPPAATGAAASAP